MKNRFAVYSKLRKFVVNEEEGWEDWEDIESGVHYTLLEFVNKSWYGDKNKGLAMFIGEDSPIYKAVKAIEYYCENNFIVFNVVLSDGCVIDDYIEGKSLKESICQYISAQISDGWGENGVFLYNFYNDEVFRAECSSTLYERDYEESYRLGKADGSEWLDFDKYPAYKTVI